MTTRRPGKRFCIVCEAELTKDEVRYYGHTCDRCERKWQRRIDLWRQGNPDPALDVRFQPAPQRLH